MHISLLFKLEIRASTLQLKQKGAYNTPNRRVQGIPGGGTAPPWDLWTKVKTNKQTDKLNLYIDTKLLGRFAPIFYFNCQHFLFVYILKQQQKIPQKG